MTESTTYRPGQRVRWVGEDGMNSKGYPAYGTEVVLIKREGQSGLWLGYYEHDHSTAGVFEQHIEPVTSDLDNHNESELARCEGCGTTREDRHDSSCPVDRARKLGQSEPGKTLREKLLAENGGQLDYDEADDTIRIFREHFDIEAFEKEVETAVREHMVPRDGPNTFHAQHLIGLIVGLVQKRLS